MLGREESYMNWVWGEISLKTHLGVTMIGKKIENIIKEASLGKAVGMAVINGRTMYRGLKATKRLGANAAKRVNSAYKLKPGMKGYQNPTMAGVKSSLAFLKPNMRKKVASIIVNIEHGK
jgi:hypothetical protein